MVQDTLRTVEVEFIDFAAMKVLFFLFFGIYAKQVFAAPATHSQNITFTLSAESLPCEDIELSGFQLPDPFVSIYTYVKTPGEDPSELQPFGLTSTIRDDSNPEWSDKFSYIWRNGTGQTWLFWVFDHDHASSDDPIGVAEVSVDRFMESDGELKLNLKRSLNENSGSLTITRFPYQKKPTLPIAFKLSAKNLPPRDRIQFFGYGYMGESDPYAVILYDNGVRDRVAQLHKTGIFTNEPNPVWKKTIEFPQYNENANQMLYFKLYDRDLWSNDEFLGDASILASELKGRTGNVTIPLRNSEGDAQIVLHMYTSEKAGEGIDDGLLTPTSTRSPGLRPGSSTRAPPTVTPTTTEPYPVYEYEENNNDV